MQPRLKNGIHLLGADLFLWRSLSLVPPGALAMSLVEGKLIEVPGASAALARKWRVA